MWKKGRSRGHAGRENLLHCRGAVGSHPFRPSSDRWWVRQAAWMLCDVSGVPTGQHQYVPGRVAYVGTAWEACRPPSTTSQRCALPQKSHFWMPKGQQAKRQQRLDSRGRHGRLHAASARAQRSPGEPRGPRGAAPGWPRVEKGWLPRERADVDNINHGLGPPSMFVLTRS